MTSAFLANPSPYIRLHESDNVAVVTRETDANIPRGHKIALMHIPQGDVVRKYGSLIGRATCDIAQGDHVHSHNLAFVSTSEATLPAEAPLMAELKNPFKTATFDGYRRASGQVGTRNQIAVLSTVNCSATAAAYISRRFSKAELKAYPHVDAVTSFVHGTGCGMDVGGDGLKVLQRVLWGYARHPNVGGVLLVGLGCEVNQLSFLLDAYGITPGPTFKVMTIQDIGGTQQVVDAGIAAIREMLPLVNEAVRKPCPISELKLALQCGGSDAWSGMTANPALGYASDLLVDAGGSAVLAETPEIYGAEHLLKARATSLGISEKLDAKINWWKSYTAKFGGSVDNNPSPGNKRGGLTTILEKSLGAVAKAGTSPLVSVIDYAEPLAQPGLSFMDSPGYDPVSVTGQIASGCNMVCFTTGRGSAFGSRPAPSIKLSSNSNLARRMPGDIDVDCGAILEHGVSIPEMGERILSKIIAHASGTPTKSEALGLGDLEFVPWQIGATM